MCVTNAVGDHGARIVCKCCNEELPAGTFRYFCGSCYDADLTARLYGDGAAASAGSNQGGNAWGYDVCINCAQHYPLVVGDVVMIK